jgi:sensor histidine kinase YesM
MTSQIQPHFIYNTLSAISTLIDINPSEAQKALDEFTSYLRMNFSTLTETKLVPFDDELKHIKTYVNLEKLRFRNRLEVEYDIREHNFSLPPLSIQPLVENAIKHGILKRIEGGKVILKSYQEEEANVVEVIDDGVGFDPESAELKTNKHIGLKNVASRISTMIHGEMNIYSKPNEGTRIVVRFYR